MMTMGSEVTTTFTTSKPMCQNIARAMGHGIALAMNLSERSQDTRMVQPSQMKKEDLQPTVKSEGMDGGCESHRKRT